ncbi:hypothetical protein ACFV4P_02005 [Kitasatospora sp. NPDC059795]|uniref:hypothetical protein n=1 Tax=Kitasatospora sp. NPDC059795 TaxID=3346949 RepID=UPI0036672AC8
MKSSDFAKGDLVECVVVTHRHYGPNTRTVVGGAPGFIDSTDVSDDPADRDWPPVGRRLACLVLGDTKDGRLRLSCRPRDVELGRSVADVVAAVAAWRTVCDAESEVAVGEFLRTADAGPTLRWALRHPAGAWRTRAEAMVERASGGVPLCP